MSQQDSIDVRETLELKNFQSECDITVCFPIICQVLEKENMLGTRDISVRLNQINITF
jgi:hypothetical protein